VSPARTRWLGLLGVLLYVGHAGRRALLGHPEHLLWMCHVGALLVATGLLAQAATVNAIGTHWLVVGLPLWLADLARGAEFFPTSILTHVGGLLLGLIALRALGVPRGAWWTSAVALVALAAASRALTPADDDVNLAFTMLPAGATPPTTIAVAAGALAVSAAAFYAVERGLRLLGFRAAQAC
jgi:hypothetical protein